MREFERYLHELRDCVLYIRNVHIPLSESHGALFSRGRDVNCGTAPALLSGEKVTQPRRRASV